MADLTQTSADIVEAKNSPIYNPSLDSVDIGIYNLLNQTDPSQELLDEYTRAFMSMSTINPYENVLQNPQTCDLSDAKTSLSDAGSALNDAYNNGSSINPDTGETVANKDNPNWVSEMDPTNTSGIYYQLFNDPYNGTGFADPTDTSLSGDNIIFDPNTSSVTSALDAISTQTSKLTSNLPSILSMIQSSLGMAAVAENLLNPCLGIGDFLGTLLSDGKNIINKIESYMKQITDLISAGIDFAMTEIKSLMSTISSYIQQALTFIKNEIKKLVKSLLGSVHFGLSGFLKGLNLDACAKGLVQTMLTGSATALLAAV